MVIMQFFRIDQSNPAVEQQKDIITLTQPSEEVAALLKDACYDCHSHETKYPWYANVAPISWMLAHHRDEGREEMNFSVWGEYSEKRSHHKLEESIEMIEEGEMPMESYVWFHPEADLSKEQKELLMEWFRSKM